jgi:hypothetical protein
LGEQNLADHPHGIRVEDSRGRRIDVPEKLERLNCS